MYSRFHQSLVSAMSSISLLLIHGSLRIYPCTGRERILILRLPQWRKVERDRLDRVWTRMSRCSFVQPRFVKYDVTGPLAKAFITKVVPLACIHTYTVKDHCCNMIKVAVAVIVTFTVTCRCPHSQPPSTCNSVQYGVL